MGLNNDKGDSSLLEYVKENFLTQLVIGSTKEGNPQAVFGERLSSA